MKWSMICGVMLFSSVLSAQNPQTQHRLHQLESEIASLREKKAAAAPVEVSGLEAGVQVRLIAHGLLERSQQARPEAHLFWLYGQTLADGAARLDEVLNQAAAMQKLIDDKDPEAATADRYLQAMKKFLAIAAEEGAAPQDLSAGALDDYLRRLFSPLAAVAASSGRSYPQSSWIAPAAADHQGLRLFRPADLDRLEQRINSSPLEEPTRQQMLRMVEKMRRGWGHPDLRPHVVAFFDRMNQALNAADILVQAEWLGGEAQGMRQQIHEAMLLIEDPRTRPSGMRRLDQLDRSLDAARRLAELHRLGTPVENLQAVFLAAHKLQLAQAGSDLADGLFNYLEQLTGTMLLYRQWVGADPAARLLRAAKTLGTDYQKLELALLGKLPRLSVAAGEVQEKTWQDPLTDLTAAAQRLRRVHQVTGWAEKLESYGPKPAGRLNAALLETAEKLADPAKQADADAGLQELEEDFERFAPLPHEKFLRLDDPRLRQVTEDAHLLLLEQVDRLRSQWASAWATGGTQVAAVRQKLERMARCLEAIHSAALGTDALATADRLNRWAAWELPAPAYAALAQDLPQQVRQATRFAAIANWEALEEQLRQLTPKLSVPRFSAVVQERLTPGLDGLQNGPEGLIAQCVFGPAAGAFGADHRVELASLCRHLVEADHARRNKQDAEADRHAARAREAVDRLMANWEAP